MVRISTLDIAETDAVAQRPFQPEKCARMQTQVSALGGRHSVEGEAVALASPTVGDDPTLQEFADASQRLWSINGADVPRSAATSLRVHGDHQFSIPKHGYVRAVRSDDELPRLLGCLKVLDDGGGDEWGIEMILRLIDDQRLTPTGNQQEAQEHGSLLAGRQLVELSLSPTRLFDDDARPVLRAHRLQVEEVVPGQFPEIRLQLCRTEECAAVSVGIDLANQRVPIPEPPITHVNRRQRLGEALNSR